MIELEKLKRRFQFLAGITLFFPVLLEAMFKAGGVAETAINKYLSLWGAEIFLLVTNFIILEYDKRFIRKSVFKLTNISILATLTCFGIVSAIFAAIQQTGQLPGYFGLLFTISFVTILVLPLGIPLMFLFNCLSDFFQQE